MADQPVIYTPAADRVWELTHTHVRYFKQHPVHFPHLLLALWHFKEGIAGQVLREAGIEYAQLDALIRSVPPQLPNQSRYVSFSPDIRSISLMAIAEAYNQRSLFVDTQHLLIALLRGKYKELDPLFKEIGTTRRALIAKVLQVSREMPPPALFTYIRWSDYAFMVLHRLFPDYALGWRNHPARSTTLLSPISPETNVALAQEMIVLQPDNPVWYGQRGMSFIAMQRYSEAELDLGKSSGIDHKNDMYYRFFRGIARVHLKKYQEAIDDFELVSRERPTFPNIHVNLGCAKAQLALWESARLDLDKGIHHYPNDINLRLMRAYVALMTRDFEVVIEDCAVVRAQDATMFDTYGYCGIVYLEQENYAEAERSFLEAIRLRADSPSGYGGMAMVMLKRENYVEALEYADKIQTIDPERANSYYVRGKVYAVRGEREKAVADFQSALKYWVNLDAPLHKPYIDEMKAYLTQE